jgi:hypothetical protein
MANKNKLKEMLDKRTTLPQREAVKPVNLYTSPQVDKTTEYNKVMEVVKNTKPQTVKKTSKQIVKITKPLAVKQAKPLVVKYTTHLDPKLIKAIKQLSLDTDKKDYEVVGEAIGEYLKKWGTPHN